MHDLISEGEAESEGDETLTIIHNLFLLFIRNEVDISKRLSGFIKRFVKLLVGNVCRQQLLMLCLEGKP